MSHREATVPGRRLAALVALVSAPCAIATLVLFSMATGGNVYGLFDGNSALSLPSDRQSLLVAAYWLDIAGYYLLLIPAVIYVWKLGRAQREALSDIAAVCGLIYLVMGGLAAATQAAAYSLLQEMYAKGDPGASAAWVSVAAGQWLGVWQLEAIMGAVWIYGASRSLLDRGKVAIGTLSLLISVGWTLQFISVIGGNIKLGELFSNLVVVISPIWAFWLGIGLLRWGDR